MSTWFWNSRSSAAPRSGSTVLGSGSLSSKLMMTLRVQVMWSSQSFRVASWNASADWLIGATPAGGLPLAGPAPAPAPASTASAESSATIAMEAEVLRLR
jgi:hypothetical protein